MDRGAELRLAPLACARAAAFSVAATGSPAGRAAGLAAPERPPGLILVGLAPRKYRGDAWGRILGHPRPFWEAVGVEAPAEGCLLQCTRRGGPHASLSASTALRQLGVDSSATNGALARPKFLAAVLGVHLCQQSVWLWVCCHVQHFSCRIRSNDRSSDGCASGRCIPHGCGAARVHKLLQPARCASRTRVLWAVRSGSPAQLLWRHRRTAPNPGS